MESSTAPVLSAHQVSKSFADKTILNDIRLAIKPAEIFGLLGPSGSGKTTLVKLLAGIDVPTTGEIRLLGTLLPNRSMLQQIGYMAQSDALYNELTARENMEFFAALYGLKGRRGRDRIAETAELVGLSEHLSKKAWQYSGGMKRRLSLAIALLHEPPVLLLDEPTVGIDPVLRRSIWAELKTLTGKGTTVVLTTHVMDEADKCDRLAMIRDGHILAEGSPEALLEQTGSDQIEDAFIQLGGGNS
ncbi:ABC transporter ATP-binding protein [Paenibacillus physcomitrellae]|uniref:ABC transporter ATP-binding protein n=1 Tax=Paenibacillus physcomitrellae TaxID=1619311 RepID=A0ABQ1G459_9BACL|nr:ABC transporter ATP-binding protein [Paenibacillus physcomitrellae]GGA36264.1 ABC transporter ATP-binding protein [Paenibacillus physcomitrellae]